MNEVVFTTSSGDAVVSVNVWDSKTGTNLMSYRGGGVINPKGLHLLGCDYLVAAEKSKPILRIWSINSQQPLHSPRLLCPGNVSVIACSPDCCYIAIAVDEKLHVYQVSSGFLVGSGVRHFQAITVIRWSFDGSIVACGGEDGMITVWSLSSLLNKESQQIASDPHYIFNDHSLPVTDLILTSGGSSCYRSRLISVSADSSCKIYDLSTGKLLLSVIFTEMLTSVSISPSEMEIFVGCKSGDINQFSLRDPKSINSPEIHISTGLLSGNKNLTNVFRGHKNSVTCLSVSIDGERLLSGSLDESVRIWHVTSKHCLKILNLKGPVTNAFFTNAPKQMLEQDIKRNIMLCPFQKVQASNDEEREYSLQIFNYNDLDVSCYDREKLPKIQNSVWSDLTSNDYSMKDEINRLRSINERLYKISVEQLLKQRIEDGSSRPNYSNETKETSKQTSNKSQADSIIENIFDNLISYQEQPDLRNKSKKKKKKGKKKLDNKSKEESKDVLVLKTKKHMLKSKGRKKSKNKNLKQS